MTFLTPSFPMFTQMRSLKPAVLMVFSLTMLVSAAVNPARAEILTPSEFVIIMDHDSGDILFEKNMAVGQPR